MRRFLLAISLSLASAVPAHAGLGMNTSGLWGELAGGLGAAGLPFRPGIGATVAIGGFVGRYDDAFSVGKRWQLGVRAREDLVFANGKALASRTAILFDVERGVDLLLIGLRAGLEGGPLIHVPLNGHARTVGGTVRATGALTYRFAVHTALLVRADLGVDIVAQRAAPALGLMLGFEFAGPVRTELSTR